MSLPIFQSAEVVKSTEFQLLQTNWAQQLNPLLANPMASGRFVKSVTLATGVTIINHLLQRPPQGWFITDISAGATVYRSAPFNALTLTLTSSASAIADIYVF